MKKRYALLLTTALSMAVTCNVMAAEDITGEWYGNMYGMPVVMVLDESGDYSVEIDGEESTTGTWELDGELLYMDKGTEYETTYAFDGETISISEDGMELSFSRDADAAAGFEPAETRTDSKIEEFAGNWTATQVSAWGMIAPLEMLEIESVELEIADNKVNFIMAGGDAFGEWEVKELEGELEEGILTFAIETEDEYSEDSIWTWTVQLLEDGMMSLSTEMADEPLIFYLEVAEAEESEETAEEAAEEEKAE